MVEAVMVVLIICALIAAIFGREAAQKLLGVFIGIAILLVSPIIFLSCKAYREMGTPGGTSNSQGYIAPGTSPLTYPVNPVTSASISPLYIGFEWQPLYAWNGDEYHLPAGYGIFVTHVDPGSPADAVGIKSGDYISQADQQWLTTTYTLDNAKVSHRAGDTMMLTVLRRGVQYNVTVRLMER